MSFEAIPTPESEGTGDGVANLVDFDQVSTIGLESSPVAEALAGLRAHEARYFMGKYQHPFTVVPAHESRSIIEYVNRILKEERGIEITAEPLETSRFQIDNILWTYVFYRNGLAINVMYAIDDPKKVPWVLNCPRGWKYPKNWPIGLNSPARNPG